jgi:hypothetical protein
VSDNGADDIRALESGLDLHEWQSERASIDEEAADAPDAAVSRLAELVHRMLRARGYAVDDPVAREGDEPELVVGYLAARETAERAELGEASRADVESALEELRAIFDTLAAEHP